MAATAQRGADLIVNTVGGSVFAENVRALAFEGRLATVGYVDGVMHAEIDLAALHAKRLTLFGVSNKLRSKAQRAAAVPRFVAEVVPLIAAGRIEPRIDRVVDFAQPRRRQGAHGRRRPCRQDRPAHAGRVLTVRFIEESTPMKRHHRSSRWRSPSSPRRQARSPRRIRTSRSGS